MVLQKKKELRLEQLLPTSSLLVLGPDFILDDIADERDDEGHQQPSSETRNRWHGIDPPERAHKEKMFLLTSKFTTEEGGWMKFEDQYHLVGLYEGKPAISRRAISLSHDLKSNVKVISCAKED